MIKILKNLTKKEWGFTAICLGLIIIQVWLDLTLPEYMGDITELVQTPGSEMNEILAAGGRMLLLASGSLAVSVVIAGLAARISTNLASRLRTNLFKKVQSFTMQEINNFSIPSLITRTTNDITQVQMLVVIGLQILIKSPILAVWAIVKILDKGWQWSLATGIAVIALLVVSIVSFRYPDAEDYVLQDISFQANKGETVAFIGATGCGKSTVINLIPRFYDATEGGVYVDGINVKDFTQAALRNKIGYVSQKAVLFKGDVASNVSFGSNGTDGVSKEAVVSAITTAQSRDFVENMDDSYQSYIAPGGTNLSGGQKQRLSIARAIARDPEILIFDDSFSALDYKTDKILRRELRLRAADATIIIVAQRIGTIKDADRIIVLEEGRIAGMGTHRELMKSCDLYKEIAHSQLSKEELENE